jgi:hypothetical protein
MCILISEQKPSMSIAPMYILLSMIVVLPNFTLFLILCSIETSNWSYKMLLLHKNYSCICK